MYNATTNFYFPQGSVLCFNFPVRRKFAFPIPVSNSVNVAYEKILKWVTLVEVFKKQIISTNHSERVFQKYIVIYNRLCGRSTSSTSSTTLSSLS